MDELVLEPDTLDEGSRRPLVQRIRNLDQAAGDGRHH